MTRWSTPIPLHKGESVRDVPELEEARAELERIQTKLSVLGRARPLNEDAFLTRVAPVAIVSSIAAVASGTLLGKLLLTWFTIRGNLLLMCLGFFLLWMQGLWKFTDDPQETENERRHKEIESLKSSRDKVERRVQELEHDQIRGSLTISEDTNAGGLTVHSEKDP